METSQLIFITGGARSGKSSFAEQLAYQYQKQKDSEKLLYIACGVSSDKEMESRIALHQEDRSKQSTYWETIEKPYALHEVVKTIPDLSICVLDCITTLLSNELYYRPQARESIISDIITGVKGIVRKCSIFIVVSNEVTESVPIQSDIVLAYQQMLGMIHQQLVKESNQAIHMNFGIPLVMKGRE